MRFAITRRVSTRSRGAARDRFLARDWRGSHDDAAERLQLYSRVLAGLTSRVRELDGRALTERVWSGRRPRQSIRRSLRNRFAGRSRRAFSIRSPAASSPPKASIRRSSSSTPTLMLRLTSRSEELCRRYRGAALPDLLADALTDADGAGFCEGMLVQSRARDVAAAERIAATIGSRANPLRSRFSVAFFTADKALTWWVADQWPMAATPLAFCLHHPEESGLTLDAVLIGESDLAILFSYTRAYFRVAAPSPYELVQWLRQLMPGKRVADLYNAIGFNRHAKTEFYRDFVRHLQKFARSFHRRGRRARHGHARLHAAEL